MTALPIDYSLPVSERFAAMERARVREAAESEAENNLMASLHALAMPNEQRWQKASNRLREERLMGLMPPRRTITATHLMNHPGEVVFAAHGGEHVTVTEFGHRAVMIVSAAEYARLKVEMRMHGWEEGSEAAPDDWGRE